MATLSPVSFSRLPGWADDDHAAALETLARQAMKPAEETYRTGSFGLDPQALHAFALAAGETRSNPRKFFEDNCVPHRVVLPDDGRGMVTGFYEPIVEARRTKEPGFEVPLLARPDDLVAVNDKTRPAGLDESYRFARRMPDGTLAEYFDRPQIEKGALQGQGLELAWLADPVDAFFIHVQGAARLKLEDGAVMRVTYDGKSGHPFTAIGALLVKRGEIALDTISMRSIRKWLADHPGEAQSLMHENRSYIFFKQAEVPDPALGPVAAAKIPLTPGRSLAVDRLQHTFGTPVFVAADRVNGEPFNRLMIAQETGTAIVGAARGDLFFGSGDEAGEMAGAVRSACDFYLLVPHTCLPLADGIVQ